MSTSVTPASVPRAPRLGALWNSAVGKKALMDVTGIVLFLFVLVHMIGNLQAFQGAEKINHYAELLRTSTPFLWFTRIVLLVAALVHRASRESSSGPTAARAARGLPGLPSGGLLHGVTHDDLERACSSWASWSTTCSISRSGWSTRGSSTARCTRTSSRASRAARVRHLRRRDDRARLPPLARALFDVPVARPLRTAASR